MIMRERERPGVALVVLALLWWSPEVLVPPVVLVDDGGEFVALPWRGVGSFQIIESSETVKVIGLSMKE